MMLKSDFMGEALRTGSQARRPAAALPAQALFGKKAPKQAEKAGSQAKGGAQKAVKQAQKSLPSLPNFGGGAKKAAKQTQKKAGGGGGFQLPNFGGQAKKAGSQAKKATSKGPAKKAGSQAKKASNQASKATKGWLGGAGGAKNLDKFYGAYHAILCCLLPAASVKVGHHQAWHPRSGQWHLGCSRAACSRLLCLQALIAIFSSLTGSWTGMSSPPTWMAHSLESAPRPSSTAPS